MRNMNKEKVNEKISDWNKHHTLTPEQRSKLLSDRVERAKWIIFNRNRSEKIERDFL